MKIRFNLLKLYSFKVTYRHKNKTDKNVIQKAHTITKTSLKQSKNKGKRYLFSNFNGQNELQIGNFSWLFYFLKILGLIPWNLASHFRFSLIRNPYSFVISVCIAQRISSCQEILYEDVYWWSKNRNGITLNYYYYF